jgi:DNA-binding transcriptional MerR regulator
MPGIRTNAAAEVLGVSPNTLRSWERRYGFPTPKRTQGNHRNYELVELQTLRDALAQTGNISSAIELTRQRQAAPASDGSLFAALESFDEEAANRAVEESLALRPLERTVEELLLPAIDRLAADPDRDAELEFASRWATGWLHGARRLASAASRPAGILLLDSSSGSDAEAVHAQALDLTLRRAGFRVLMLSNQLGDERLERALRALDPTAIVICGPGADTAGAVKLVRKIREVGFDAPLLGFRASGLIGDAVPSAGATPSEVTGTCAAAPPRPSPERAPQPGGVLKSKRARPGTPCGVPGRALSAGPASRRRRSP